VVLHEIVHTVDALSGYPDVFRQPLGFLLRRVPNLHVQWQPQLSAEHGDRRRHPRALVNAAVARQHDKRQHVIPLVRVPINNDGQHVEQRPVEPLRMFIPLRVVIERIVSS
ncbi:ATP-dependent Clp protease, ATP-binding subunit ClpB, partial [Trichinella spiralis]|uniref:ATP-dependent Clp protease, ATP-binding subunit ClpB n=1 Tax=Trichinella spiralis TaxID=6334 RepID=UPI0001EFEDE9